MDSTDIIDKINENWNDSDALQRMLLDVAIRQIELSRLIAAEDVNLSAAFVTEREESIKGTDSLARARAKSLIGGGKIVYEYEFLVLDNLIRIITSRISLLSTSRELVQ